MSKFLLIGSVAAMLYGDCAWGIEEIDPWADMSSRNSIDSRENAPALNSGQFSDESARENASPNIRSRRNSTAFSQDAQTQTKESQFEQSWSGQTHANPQQLQENRFIKIETKHNQIQGMANGLTGAILNNTYLQYHYDLSNNSKIGQATPTTIETITREDLRSWSDISEIRYANDVSYDKLENPKAILYRNMDKSCYIILRIKDTKYDVFYGLNERNIEVGRSSFAVYEMSDYVGSFTDNVARLIYVDESGLYFVPKAENSVEDVIKTYQAEGKFNFKGSVVKVSAVDGSITWNGEPITKDNFFDNWVVEEKEVKEQISGAKTVIEKKRLTVLSTAQPKPNEILRNFRPLSGYGKIYCLNRFGNWLNIYSDNVQKSPSGTIYGLMGKDWFHFFINRCFVGAKVKSEKAEELVRNGTFASILETYTDKDRGNSYNNDYRTNPNGYGQKVRDAIAAQVAAKGKSISINNYNASIPAPISEMVSRNSLFKDPEFVRSLKSDFAKLEKDYEESRIAGSDKWLPFEIVRNL